VLVAQGDDDEVIPRELLDRTWAYVTEESGAAATAQRYPGGHGLAPGAVKALREWVAAVTAS
jgi:phospholipase/carboxylesterase